VVKLIGSVANSGERVNILEILAGISEERRVGDNIKLVFKLLCDVAFLVLWHKSRLFDFCN
jgi:hypothetical protein